jgi:hypothetical protein
MPGRQGICALRNPIPLAGAPTSLGLPPRHLFSLTFLPVVSRRKPRALFTCRGRLQNHSVSENQYGGPGQVQRLVRRRPLPLC